MKCPECQHEFTLKHYWTSVRGIHQCPKCGMIGKLEHKNNLHALYYIVILILMSIAILMFIEMVIRELSFLENPLSFLFSIMLTAPFLLFIDYHHDNKRKIFKKYVGKLPGKRQRILINFFFFPALFYSAVFISCLYLFAYKDYLPLSEVINNFNKKQKEMLTPYKEEILADLKLLSKESLFKDYPRTRDVSIFIDNKLLRGNKITNQLWKKNKKWWESKETLVQLRKSADELNIDTSWVSELNNFDYWQIENIPKFKEKISQVSTFSSEKKAETFKHLQQLDYYDLDMLLYLNFLRLEKQGKALEGLKTIRKMAEIYYTLGTSGGNSHAANLLRKEYLFSEKFSVKNWKLAPMSKIEAFWRINFSGQQLFQYAWLQDFYFDIEPYLNRQTGMCGAGFEMLMSVFEYQDMLKSQFIFEEDLSSILNKNLAFQHHLLKVCKKEEYAIFLAETPAAAAPWFMWEKQPDYTADIGKEPDVLLTMNIKKIPYLRKHMALDFLIMGERNYLKPYIDLKEAQQVSK